MNTERKATTLRLTEQDIQAVLTIRQYYGCASDNQAIILALNLVARQIEEGKMVPNPSRPERKAHSSPA